MKDTSKSPKRYRLFVSSPGDVEYERQLLLEVIEQLQYEAGLRGRITLEAVAWDKEGAGTPMLATMTPQEAINLGLPKPSECDIVVVIFWARMGTPLPPVYEKSDGGRYFSGTEWEYKNAVEFSQKTGKPIVIVYRRTQVPAVAFDDPDFDEKRKQWKRVQDFFATFREPDGSLSGGYNEYTSPDDFQKKVEDDLRSLIYRLIEGPRSSERVEEAESESIPRWEGSPFPGLRPLQPEDAPIFFGRGREIDDLIARLANINNQFLAVVGSSGTGKSSLVAAGLLPRLSKNAIEGSKDWQVVRFTPAEIPNGDVFDAFAAALLRDLPALKPHPVQYPRLRRELAEELQSHQDSLNDVFVAALADYPHWAKVLLFIDQFEEIFREINTEEIELLITSLVNAMKGGKCVTIVTLRADFYARSLELPTLAALLKKGTYPLGPPGLASLLEMITRPAALAGLEFEAGLIDRILEDAGRDSGALPLLAYTLHELYAQKSEKLLTHNSYDSLGGVQGVIATRAENTLESLDEQAQKQFERVFHNLIEVDQRGIAIKKRASVAQMQKNAAAIQFIEAFTEARLFIKGRGEKDEPVIEVAHEALLHSWPRLADWIDRVRDDLRLLRQVRDAAEEWDKAGRNPDFLWRGERSKSVQAMIQRLQPRLNPVELLFTRSEIEWLEEEVNDTKTDHYRRAAIGDRLAQIGDTRPGVGLKEDRLPEIMWCQVPEGKVTLVDIRRGRIIKEFGSFTIRPFHIAKYPITWLQYKAFLESSDGYSNSLWWDGLAIRQDKPGQQARLVDNHPVDNVSWYDAVAYCRWLSEKLGYEIRLPTEWEWQQAATGGNSDNLFPWGDETNSDFANTYESGLGRSTAVGMYPQGASPISVLDMSGNVREWCLNAYEIPEYVDLGGENQAEGQRARSLRGGSWRYDLSSAMAAYRYGRYTPDTRNDSLGFRIATDNPVFEEKK